jgi:hypothetical protein
MYCGNCGRIFLAAVFKKQYKAAGPKTILLR